MRDETRETSIGAEVGVPRVKSKTQLRWLRVVAMITFLLIPAVAAAAEVDFAELEPNERIADFRTEALYTNEAGVEIGARFRHVPTRFVLDVLRIQSLPQAFMWVNSFPPSDKGEPHTLEHLLLGKGTVGRRVASLEEMSLGNSSAYTEQRRTCYHFNTAAGSQTFFDLFEAKLHAMLHPNYSDEEIRREVCNMGVADGPDGELRLEEKGTVYNEMVSTFERPWGNLFHEMGKMIYGDGHPLSYSAGGTPAGIRDLTAEEIRVFHANTHHLNNMGAVVSIGAEVTLEECLNRLSDVLERVEPDGKAGTDPASAKDRLPEARPSPLGSILHTHFPNENPNEPGVYLMSWPAERELSLGQQELLRLFLGTFANGQTSTLHKIFIDSRTREMDLGANSVFGWLDDDLGQPVYIGMSGIDPSAAAPEKIHGIRARVLQALETVSSWEPGSEDLEAFQAQARSNLLQRRRSIRTELNSPPRFGYRGQGSSLIDKMQALHEVGGFHRDLSFKSVLDSAEVVLQTEGNPWAELLSEWGLFKEPFVAVATADPDAIPRSEQARQDRIQEFTAKLRAMYEVESDLAAIVRYQGDYEERTREIDETAAGIDVPALVESPPMTLDDALDFEAVELVPERHLVSAYFDNMTAATAGLALRLDAVPESLLVYVAGLPTLFRGVGAIEDGERLSFDEMDRRLKEEIFDLDVYFSTNTRTERAEIAFRGSGTDQAESLRALEWIRTILLNPNHDRANLPQIRDAIDQALGASRNRMRRSEESWVRDPADAYWRQDNPLFLSTASFLTQTHDLLRLRWLFSEANESDLASVRAFLLDLATSPEAGSREEFDALLTALAADGTESPSEESLTEADEQTRTLAVWMVARSRLSEPAGKHVDGAIRDLRRSLADLSPDAFQEDVRYLAERIVTDLATSPAVALQRLNESLDYIRRQDNARAFVVGNREDAALLGGQLRELINELDAEPSARIEYGNIRRIDARLASRSAFTGESAKPPVYVGLVNESTRAGVHIHTADCASYFERDEEELLRFLAARLYGGGGAHSMFMKTWSAGLAYSNGLRSNENVGRLLYYAERCPDLPQTLKFVIEQLENAPDDPSLAEYAIAQAFVGIRSGSRYEERGEAMADDYADELTPEVVSGFRERILEIGTSKTLPQDLASRMEDIYGTVLPGYGPSSAESVAMHNANYFVIGPESQLSSWQQYLGSVDAGAQIHRIYPRDFWLAPGSGGPGD